MSTSKESRMNGKTIAVTGAVGRLGRHVLEELENRGANVAAIVLNDAEARLVPSGQNGRTESFVVDVTDEESVRNGFERIADRFKGLDGLVHTVGAWGMTPILETSRSDWENLILLNLTSAFLCFREAGRLMSAGSGGTLVAITSSQGADRAAGGQGAYSAAKAGVVRLVEAAADELSPHGITSLAVAPSMIIFDPSSGEVGVHVTEVVSACLQPWSDSAPASGEVLRVYGSIG
jgi:3-oxoacyl-[acyl-carrier protein] reductase